MGLLRQYPLPHTGRVTVLVFCCGIILVPLSSIIASAVGGCFPCKDCVNTECSTTYHNTSDHDHPVCKVTRFTIYKGEVRSGDVLRPYIECQQGPRPRVTDCFLHNEPNKAATVEEIVLYPGHTSNTLEEKCPTLFWTYLTGPIALGFGLLYDFYVFDIIIFLTWNGLFTLFCIMPMKVWECIGHTLSCRCMDNSFWVERRERKARETEAWRAHEIEVQDREAHESEAGRAHELEIARLALETEKLKAGDQPGSDASGASAPYPEEGSPSAPPAYREPGYEPISEVPGPDMV